MPWGVFTVALLIVYVLQTAVAGYVLPAGRIFPAALDLFLALALLCALMGRVTEACYQAWIIGLAHDLAGGGAIGVYAVALGLLAILLTTLREYVNQGVWWVRLLVAVLGALLANAVVLLHVSVVGRFLHGGPPPAWDRDLSIAILSATLAAALATGITQLPWLLERSGRRRWRRRA